MDNWWEQRRPWWQSGLELLTKHPLVAIVALVGWVMLLAMMGRFAFAPASPKESPETQYTRDAHECARQNDDLLMPAFGVAVLECMQRRGHGGGR